MFLCLKEFAAAGHALVTDVHFARYQANEMCARPGWTLEVRVPPGQGAAEVCADLGQVAEGLVPAGTAASASASAAAAVLVAASASAADASAAAAAAGVAAAAEPRMLHSIGRQYSMALDWVGTCGEAAAAIRDRSLVRSAT